MGNVAAVLVGIIAISCVLAFASFLRNMNEVPAAYENGNGDNGYNVYENGDSADETPAPTLPPEQMPVFPYGLPLPRVLDTLTFVFLEEGQEHMTINNPWQDVGHIAELPVFLPHMRIVAHGFEGWTAERTEHMTDEEWDVFAIGLLQRTTDIAYLLSIDLVDVDPFTDIEFGTRIIQHDDLLVSIETSLFGAEALVRFMPLSGVSISDTATSEQLIAIIQHLADISSLHVDIPTDTQAEITFDADRLSIHHRLRIFEPGITATDAILAFNFEWAEVSFLPEQPHMIVLVETAFPQIHVESLQLGNFSIITAEEAREMLLDGYFISERADIEWPGREVALTASVELVYHIRDANIIMPMYRFLLEVDLPPWMLGQPGEWRAFTAYYVPAVHRDYLMPMTRRETPEPIPAPTGPRALPPNIFREVQTRDWVDWGRPMRIPRHQVEDLWQEILADIGGLAVNEAYQFRTLCGHYAMITGSRNLTSHAELMRYYPDLGLPERVGDFTLREIFVNDSTNNMVIFDSPMSASEHFVFGSWSPWSQDPAPVGEIFTRELAINDHTLAFAFYAMYENSTGVQVGLGVSSLFFDLQSGLPEYHTTVDMGEYGIIHFPGYDFSGGPSLYYKAMYEPEDPWMGFAIELWYLNGSISERDNYLDMRYHQSRYKHLFTSVSRWQLEELVRLFNPSAMAREYQWQLMSWQ